LARSSGRFDGCIVILCVVVTMSGGISGDTRRRAGPGIVGRR
jgi:hypothetical protein